MKKDRPSPEPQRLGSPTSPEAAFSSAHPAGDATRSLPTVGYTPLPKMDLTPDGQRRKRHRMLAAIAAVSIAVIGAGLLVANHHTKPPQWPPASAQVASTLHAKNIFFVSDRDLDSEATESAKAALKKGQIPPSLANVPEKTRQEILSGEQSLYSVRLLDFADEDGDAVKISLNDVPFGNIVLSKLGAKLTIPLKKGVTTKITCLATADGGGGVTFRAVSSTGELRTRVMAIGESESWTISFK